MPTKFTVRTVYCISITVALIFLINDSEGSVAYQDNTGNQPRQTVTYKDAPLSNEAILAHSNGLIAAMGYQPYTPLNTADGSGKAQATEPMHTESLPVFGSDGPMNSDTGITYQAETSIAIHPTNGALALGSAQLIGNTLAIHVLQYIGP